MIFLQAEPMDLDLINHNDNDDQWHWTYMISQYTEHLTYEFDCICSKEDVMVIGFPYSLMTVPKFMNLCSYILVYLTHCWAYKTSQQIEQLIHEFDCIFSMEDAVVIGFLYNFIAGPTVMDLCPCIGCMKFKTKIFNISTVDVIKLTIKRMCNPLEFWIWSSWLRL